MLDLRDGARLAEPPLADRSEIVEDLRPSVGVPDREGVCSCEVGSERFAGLLDAELRRCEGVEIVK